MSDLARPLPHNLEAERSILGAVLLDNSALNAAIEKVRSDDFFLSQHRHIFERMVQLGEKQQGIDIVTLLEDLNRRGELEAAGGVTYLSQLADGLPRVTNVEHYARIVKEKSVLRSLIHGAAAIQEHALAAEDDPEIILDRAESVVRGLRCDSPASRLFHSPADFDAAPDLQFGIDNIVQRDAITAFGALAGHGKTLILLSICRALLNGEGSRLWDTFAVRETNARCIYLIPESSIGPFKHRLALFGLLPAVRDGRLLVRTLSAGPTPRLSDPRLLTAARDSYVALDTIVRFSNGDENSADAIAAGLATDCFNLLQAGARAVLCAHHSPKNFSTQNQMTLENLLRGSGDFGALVASAFGIRQIDAKQNILHVEHVKSRDGELTQPFELIGRPHLDRDGDLALHRAPGSCGSLSDEMPAPRSGSGAAPDVREMKAAKLELLRRILRDEPHATWERITEKFKAAGIEIARGTIRAYRSELGL